MNLRNEIRWHLAWMIALLAFPFELIALLLFALSDRVFANVSKPMPESCDERWRPKIES